MSLVALALRISAAKALQGNSTIAGHRVYDSAMLPIDGLSAKEPLPFISISTEDELARPAGRDLNNGDRTIDFVIEAAIGKVIDLPDADGNGIAVMDSDATFELALAVLTRQIHLCLFGRGGGVWGDVFRAFAKAVEETTSRRGIPVNEGQRFAARQVIFRIKSIAEPPVGGVVEGTPFHALLTALDADDAMHGMAAIIRGAIEGAPIGWPAFYTEAAVAGGLTEGEGSRVGLAPIGGHPSEPLERVTVEPAGIVLDGAAADAALPPEEQG